MIIDPLYFLVLAPAILLGIWAQVRVKSAYHLGDQVSVRSGVSGADAARSILDSRGLRNVAIELSHGTLSDHYDPRSKTLRLSQDVAYGRTAAAVGIAAHEAGHAIQDAERYAPLVIRNGVVPLAGVGSNLGLVLIMIGAGLSAAASRLGPILVWAGIGMFSLVVLFQLINLPVEFDASNRAKMALAEANMVSPEEGVVVKKVLSAAALTYVAATLSAVMTLVYFLMRFGGSSRD